MTALMNPGPLAIPPPALEDLRGRVTSAGKEFLAELGRIDTSRALHEAYLACYPHGSAAAVAQALRAQYPDKVDDIRIAEMLAIAGRALERGRPAPALA